MSHDRSVSRRFIVASASMLVLGMTMPAFSIDIPEVMQPLLAADSATHRFEEQLHQTSDGRRYRLFLAIPKAAAPVSGHPIVYMLDGNAAFSALTPELLAKVPSLIVVAIGYEGDKAFAVEARSRDYTPPRPGQTEAAADPQRPNRLVGGAPAFLETIVGPLREQVEAGLTVDADRRAIWGHSYGGLFALYALFARPDAFSRFVPVSPSTWWGDRALEPLHKNAKAHKGERAKVLIMLGDRESRSNQPVLEKALPAPGTVEMIALLTPRPDLDVTSHIFKGAQHGQTLRLSLPFALELAVSK